MRDTPAGKASSGETPEAQSAEDRAARGKCNERKSTPNFSELMDFFRGLASRGKRMASGLYQIVP
ncbi:hypothetical protein EBO34_00650 [Alteribacter keqinensis]|uniref:Uncharacterized protein n=1 Tax=Alteribacter keqinensis TaxID=2483800 RepID=A0A3M7TSC7_9BACI|nr:hypothetical protein EBO34_00650 [Alteribacter keqinensis]